MANSQHRCVFVGNIPYDATEEQLIQICEEVGPVVSFRLVIDRETGKPKGYGFCEYKDEETALSARRNLQGYEINGRQLRVDFAENDKNADRNREQGRGGPSLTSNADPQKQLTVSGDSILLQPVGLPVAMAAATIMAGVLGGSQTGSSMSSGLQNQPVLGTDPLTLHLAKIPKIQLSEILTEMKVVATQNKESARQLLLSSPQLGKAIFQAHIMLGTVSPQMLQAPNIRQAPVPAALHPVQDAVPVQQPPIQILPGIPPLMQSNILAGLMVQSQGQVSAINPNSLLNTQYSSLPQFPAQPRFQNSQLLQRSVLPGISGVPTIPSLRTQQPVNLSVRPEIQVATTSFSLKKELQPSLLQQKGVAPANPAMAVAPNTIAQSSLLIRPLLPDNGFQASSSKLSRIPKNVDKDFDKVAQFSSDPSVFHKVDPYQSSRPTKLLKVEEGRVTSLPAADVKMSGSSMAGSAQVFSKSGDRVLKSGGASDAEKLNPELPQDVESALLQQVLNLTPEQLSSLPPDQQQQVIQLQQMLRQQT